MYLENIKVGYHAVLYEKTNKTGEISASSSHAIYYSNIKFLYMKILT